MQNLNDLLAKDYQITENIHISVSTLLTLIIVFIVTAVVLKLLRKFITRKLKEGDKHKFISVFSFIKFSIYLIVLLITMQNMGIQITAILAASAALLVGVGLALQTFFQDIISGIFILLDQSVKVGDIVELDGKVGRVEEIKLRTTRAVTIDNKVLVIPNHKYLTSTLYNWTENGSKTRESITLGVAYGSDVTLVKRLLLQAAQEHHAVLDTPAPLVLFSDFGEYALGFKLIFTLDNSFEAVIPKSDIRFKINELFKEHNITIPFPQRDVRLYQNNIS